MEPDRERITDLVVKARERYLELQTELTTEHFRLQGLLSDRGANPSAVGDCYGRIAKTKIQMLGTIVELYKQQEAIIGKNHTAGSPVPLMMKPPPRSVTPQGRGGGGHGMGWVCQYVGDESSTMHSVCTNVWSSGEWSINWKDGTSSEFQEEPDLAPLV